MTMQKLKMPRRPLIIGGILAVALAGCSGGSTVTTPQSITTYGADSTFGKGLMRSYVTTQNSVPLEVGVEITEAALASPADLPAPPAGQAAVEVQMAQPPIESSVTPFLSTTMFYSPGHPPESQEVPHLHPTWFTVNDQTRFQILPNNPASFTPPAAGELPTGFISPPDPVFSFIPTIGNIYFDPTEAGYNENPFTTALSEYRFFNTHIACIALGTPNTYLLSKQSLKRPIGIPSKYPKSGYFPTTYSIRYNSSRKTYIMALGDFVYRS
ncbi:hypothetical protein IAD21_00472 [Abditibacteriota bacterium]|nr:hypothetical protein IAD21_00472 [Abditibacteriota bacterium]